MTGPDWTRAVLFATMLLLLCWEGFTLWKWGPDASISVVLGKVFLKDPIALILASSFILHACYVAKPPTP